LDRTQRTGGKNGSKRSLLVDGRGIPLSLVVSGAQRHDVKLLEPTLDHIVVKRPEAPKQHLCADKGYAGEPAQEAIESRHYIPHIRQRGEEMRAKKRNPRYKARRWVVERTLSWLNRFRKLLVRFEKKTSSHEALLELACAFIVFRRVITIYG
jgi:putative transposase